MNTTLWPHIVPTNEAIKKSPKAVPSTLAQDDYIAFPAGTTPAKIMQVQANYPAGSNNGVVECIIVWSETPEVVGKPKSYQWRSLESCNARLYTPEHRVGDKHNTTPSTTPPPGMLAALSCIDTTIQHGFKQNFQNQSELMDKLDETNRLLNELLAAFNFAWKQSGEEAES